MATRTYGAGVWNDVRRGVDCPAMDAYRQALHDAAVSGGAQTAEAEEPRGETDASPNAEVAVTTPAPQQDCLPGFGNSDIYGGSYADPTP